MLVSVPHTMLGLPMARYAPAFKISAGLAAVLMRERPGDAAARLLLWNSCIDG